MGLKVTSLGVLKKRKHGYWQCFIPCICSTPWAPRPREIAHHEQKLPLRVLVWMEGDWCGFSWYKLVCEDGARAARRREVFFKSKSKSMPQMVENVLDLFQKILKKIFEFAIVLLTSQSRCASHPLSHLSRIFNHPRVRGCSIAWQATEETDCPSQGQLCAYCTDGQVMKISILLTINGDFQLMDCDGDHPKNIVTQWTGE